MLRSLQLLCLMIVSSFALSLILNYQNNRIIYSAKKTVLKKAVVNEKISENLIEKINKNRPELLLVGDSMLGESVDADRLSRLLGKRCLKVWVGGSSSAWWYLVIKNIVSQTTPKPKFIGVFFRDNDLTLPQYRTTGNHKEWIFNLAGLDENLLMELSYFQRLSIFERLLIKIFPVYAQCEEIKDRMDVFIKRKIAAVMFNSDEREISKAISATFADRKMDKELFHQRQIQDDYAEDSFRNDMNFNPEKSFLPAMIKHSKESGAELFLVRVKRKRDIEQGKQTDELVNYIEKLETYLEEQNVELIDYTDNDAITKEHYGGGDHLNRQSGRTVFTSLLAKDLSGKIVTKSIH